MVLKYIRKSELYYVYNSDFLFYLFRKINIVINYFNLIMSQTLYETLISGISYAVQKSINEMVRLAVQRTIDKKLWLSVASTCSRNKSTDAENIRPIGSDKENLLNRYVAALIIMRKPCPETEDDIDTLKTFKLVAKRYLQLGGTLQEIQDLYNKNIGKTRIIPSEVEKNPIQKKEEYTDKPVSTDNIVKDEPVQKDSYGGMGLFDDDDIFGDDTDDISNSELIQKIVGLDITADLTTILIQQLGNKPRGWKFYKHTNDEYEKYMTADCNPNYEWKYKKYVKDVIKVIKQKNWTCYEVTTPTNWLSSFKIENLTDALVRDYIQKILDFYNNRRALDNQLSPEEITKMVDERMQVYRQFVKDRKRQVNAINNDYVKKLFEDDESVYRVYLSPDTGVMLLVKREMKGMSADIYNYILTFTGNINYNNDLRDKDYNKKLKEKAKLQAKKKQVFLKMLHTSCGLGKSFDYSVLFDSDDYPYMVTTCRQGNAEGVYGILQKRVYNRGKYFSLYVQTPEYTEPDSIHELVQNKEYYHVELVRFIYGKNKGKYPQVSPDHDYYIMFKPTEQGRARIDYMINNK
ncbi:MAG: hypothetical protein [Vetruanivirus porcinprimi]|uniref:Uncharacterized protein n=1 Tax=phage Lak_Megaphage_RVC_AP1_GC26 TaxID=3109224 RepID=A0ABZ0Z8D2_9CAUD|nr:MAG: hypothetical protein [phage Lak_Megaphage_RVC_AP1_GC26]